MRKRSSCDSGSGKVPTCSCGFWVAMTKNGSGSGIDWPSSVTCRSSMASSSALCALGEARLISSASTSCAKIGPRWKRNLPVSRSKIDTPSTSAGNRSLVNCTRWNDRPSVLARACASVVLPTPGMSSISRCPRASRQARHSRICSSLPRMTRLSCARTAAIGAPAAGRGAHALAQAR